MARMPSPPLRVERTLEEQLADGEVIRLQLHQHWMSMLKPVARAVAATIVWLWMLFEINRPGPFLDMMTIAVVLLWLWVIWREIERRHDWFVATDSRILRYEGLITRNVPMMKLNKVTDMTYYRSVPGRIFGYGSIIIESAGQDQALRDLNYLPEPDTAYATLAALLFGQAPKTVDKRGSWRPGSRKRTLQEEYAAAAPDVPRAGQWPPPSSHHDAPDSPEDAPSDSASGSRGDADNSSRYDEPPYRPTESAAQTRAREDSPSDPMGEPDQHGDGAAYEIDTRSRLERTLYQSPDLRRRTSREEDTGPIPIYRPRPLTD